MSKPLSRHYSGYFAILCSVAQFMQVPGSLEIVPTIGSRS